MVHSWLHRYVRSLIFSSAIDIILNPTSATYFHNQTLFLFSNFLSVISLLQIFSFKYLSLSNYNPWSFQLLFDFNSNRALAPPGYPNPLVLPLWYCLSIRLSHPHFPSLNFTSKITSSGVWDRHVHTAIFKMDKQLRPTESLFSVMWQLGWEGSLGENGYMYMYGWVFLLSTWNYHNIINWLCPNIKYKVIKIK